MWGFRDLKTVHAFAALVNGYYRSKDLVYREFVVGFVPANGRMVYKKLKPLIICRSATGVLMCGISVSVLFALVTRLLDRDIQSSRNKFN